MSLYGPFLIILILALIVFGIAALMSWVMGKVIKGTTGQTPEALREAGRRSLAAWVDKA